MNKDWKYEVTLIFAGSYQDVSKADALELIKDSIVEETGLCPDDCEIKLEEDVEVKK